MKAFVIIGRVDVETLERETREADAAARAARGRLVAAVRRAYASGMSQREIAAHSNRSQPEIRRLLKFHGTTPNGRRLRANRDALVALLATDSLRSVRVFGSTARGTDHEGSDILAQVEQAASALLGVPVDLVLDDAIRPDLRDRILNEAVPL